jgi:ribonuclease J
VLHTGDWKFDPDPLVGPTADEAALRRLGDEGVLALIGDSTNALRSGTSGSEADLRCSLTELIGRYDARVAVACFASNVARLETIAHAAALHDRDVALVGRSLWRIEKAARENGYLANVPPFLREDEVGYIPRDRILMICTGSQGEPRSALSRIAREDHPHVVLETGDAVIFSSRIIPGNEKAINRLQNALVRLGVEIVTEEDHFVHVSGHPARDELVRMYQMVRPQIAIPVHGEARHLIAHAQLAGECQVQQPLVIQNGDMVRLSGNHAAIVDEVPVGRLVSDGNGLLPLDGPTLKDRRRTTFNGTAVATLVLDLHGRIVAEPKISLIGVVAPSISEEAMPLLRDSLERTIKGLPPDARRDDDAVHAVVQRALRRFLNERFAKRPLTEIHLVRI